METRGVAEKGDDGVGAERVVADDAGEPLVKVHAVDDEGVGEGEWCGGFSRGRLVSGASQREGDELGQDARDELTVPGGSEEAEGLEFGLPGVWQDASKGRDRRARGSRSRDGADASRGDEV